MSPRSASTTACVLALGLAACGGDGSPATDNPLEFRRADGTLIEFPSERAVWCDAIEPDEPSAGKALFAVVGKLGGANEGEPGWSLVVPRDQVRAGRTTSFPNEGGYPILFVAVPPRIEASSSEEEAHGRLTLERASCKRGEEVAFSVDGLLGSEFFEGESIRVLGSFSSEVGEPPEWWSTRAS